MASNPSESPEKKVKGKNKVTVYEPRERLDAELEQAIGDILSAEDEAKRIIGKAEASVKAVQLDAAASERQARENAAKIVAAYRAAALKRADEQAEEEVGQMIMTARKEGEALVKNKRAAIEKRACELFDMLRGA